MDQPPDTTRSVLRHVEIGSSPQAFDHPSVWGKRKRENQASKRRTEPVTPTPEPVTKPGFGLFPTDDWETKQQVRGGSEEFTKILFDKGRYSVGVSRTLGRRSWTIPPQGEEGSEDSPSTRGPDRDIRFGLELGLNGEICPAGGPINIGGRRITKSRGRPQSPDSTNGLVSYFESAGRSKGMGAGEMNRAALSKWFSIWLKDGKTADFIRGMIDSFFKHWLPMRSPAPAWKSFLAQRSKLMMDCRNIAESEEFQRQRTPTAEEIAANQAEIKRKVAEMKAYSARKAARR